MAHHTAAGDSVEGKRILLAGRMIVPSGGPSKDPITGRIRFGVQVKRLGAAKIMVAFDPAVPRLLASSFTAKGSVLKGNQIFGSSYTPYNVGQRKKGGAGRTHRHSGQNWTMDGDCFAQIEIDWLRTSGLLAEKPAVGETRAIA